MDDKLEAVRFTLDYVRRKAGIILEQRINTEGLSWKEPPEFAKEILVEAWEAAYGQKEKEEGKAE